MTIATLNLKLRIRYLGSYDETPATKDTESIPEHCSLCFHTTALKPGSHLCDKHNTSEISISISTMLMFISLMLCLSHKCEPGLKFSF